MIRQQIFISTIALLLSLHIQAQHQYPTNHSCNVDKYIFQLHLSDSTNAIEGETTIILNLTDGQLAFSLDLIGRSGEYGMEVLTVSEGDRPVEFKHVDNRIHIELAESDMTSRSIRIKYRGVPQRGLVISETKYGIRSFFGDNWPNLARHWLPCVDHPYDKAAIEFRVIAPACYDVVATGKKIEESNLDDGTKLTVHVEPAPVAMKVVTIGVTEFASTLLGTVDGTEVSAWVYPQNRLDGFSDYADAVKILDYFVDQIGPYSYAKLANMQAKTQWGGLENAGTIAYSENSVTGQKTVERLMAHEIAHQWFGNSVTENSWNHVWLSEGFATYFSTLYQEHAHGDEKRRTQLQRDRDIVIGFYKKKPCPIVDNSMTDPMEMLNRNAYEKGSWVLNMLRHRIGDEAFWEGCRNFYHEHRNANVMTDDFIGAMEAASGEELDAFFQQWIFTKGHPEISWEWDWDGEQVVISLDQMQKHHVFDFPIDFGAVVDGQMSLHSFAVDDKSEDFVLKMDVKPDALVIDPGMWLLFEEVE